MKTIKFIDEIYNVNYIIFIGSEEEKNNFLKDTFNLNIKNDGLTVALSYFIEDKKGGINFLYFKNLEFKFKNKKSITSNLYDLQHEIQHAAFNTFDFIGIKFDANNHEHFNYYCGYIFKNIFTLLTKD